jgi:acetyltransferase-like isoleucine patch superfamily enzyme
MLNLARILFGGVAQRWRDFQRPTARLYPQAVFQHGAEAHGECQLAEGVALGPKTNLVNCEVGRYTYFAGYSALSRCRVGAFCSLGPHLEAGFGRHPTNYVSAYPSFYSSQSAGRADFGVVTDFAEHLPITIGNDVWIGAHCLIMDGVTIGDGAFIAAGAVVAQDIPPYAIAGGVPAKVIRPRFDEEETAFLLQLKWWERDLDWIRAHAPLFQDARQLMAAHNPPESSLP